MEELFGRQADEKSVQAITDQCKEAKHSKSLEAFGIVALYATQASLTDLIVPLKQVRDSLRGCL